MLQIYLTALGLSMDAFAASIAMATQFRKLFWRLVFLAFLFGLFQGLMPLLGYALGYPFAALIAPIDHWIAFFILGFLGWKMVFKKEESADQVEALSWKIMLSLAIATSIDAFVIGIGMAALKWPVLESSLTIAGVTFLVSLLGVLFGQRFGHLVADYSEKVGGLVLIALGLKILISHLFFS